MAASPTAQIESWLATRHDGAVSDLAPVDGGFWSSAFVYRVGAEEFVFRISDMREGFEIDAAAMLTKLDAVTPEAV